MERVGIMIREYVSLVFLKIYSYRLIANLLNLSY